MKHTSPQPADRSATEYGGNNEHNISLVSIKERAIDRTDVRDGHLPKVPRNRSRGRTFRSKVLGVAIAISTVSVLIIGTIAYDKFVNKSTNEQSTQANQPSVIGADVASVPQRQLPLVLIVEILVTALLLIGLVAAYLANRSMRAVLASAATSKKSDDQESNAPLHLATQADFATEKQILEQQDDVAERIKLLTDITLRLRQSACLEELFKIAVKEVRRAIKTERVVIYSLNPNTWDRTVVAESVAPGFPQTLGFKIDAPCFQECDVPMYKNGQITAIEDIDRDSRIADCHRNMLEQFAVKANLATPIFRNKELIGFLIAHQCSSPCTWQKSDIDLFKQLATQVSLVVNQVGFLEQQEAVVERVQLIIEITLRINQSLHLEDLFKTAVKEVRRVIKSERVVIYALDPSKRGGTVVAESVVPGLPQILKVRIDDPCLKERHIQMYKNGQITAINNIYQDSRVTDCYRQLLEQFAVKANLVAPILKNNELLGLLIAHQCSLPRTWHKLDIDLFGQLATQIGFAVDQLSLLEQMEK